MKIDLESLRACPNCGVVVDFTAICEPFESEFSSVSVWVCPMCGISYREEMREDHTINCAVCGDIVDEREWCGVCLKCQKILYLFVDEEGQFVELYSEAGFRSDNIWSADELTQEIVSLEKEGYDLSAVKEFMKHTDIDLILHSNGR